MKPSVVVVGTGPGVGGATARRFATAGHRVALIARDQVKLDALAGEIDGAIGVSADVGNAAELAAAFDRIRAEQGDPGVLVYNAVGFVAGPPSQLDPDALAGALEVSVIGALRCVQQVLPAMRAAGAGTLLLTGGGLALEPWPSYSTVAMGKAAQRSLFGSLAKELKPEGIHAAQLTVVGFVKPDTFFAPERIADAHYALYAQTPEEWESEATYRESA